MQTVAFNILPSFRKGEDLSTAGCTKRGKSLLHPQPMGLKHITPTYENRFFLPCELSKTGQITPKAVLKKIIVNHRKIIKWKIQLCWIVNEYIYTINI
jgi:hypothetical protein